MLGSLIGLIIIPPQIKDPKFQLGYAAIFLAIGIFSMIDLNKVVRESKAKTTKKSIGSKAITEVVLLGENSHPIKSWELIGRVSMLLGKSTHQNTVDIDLKDTEYSTLIDNQHAVLNYANGEWFIEDLYSKNGIRIKKNSDENCYELSKNKPCKIEQGDVILLANTRLLFR